MPLGNVLIIRPGALGDAVLTLPVISALETAGAESITVLGTPTSWAFVPSTAGAPRVLDFGSSEWLGLFADGAELSARACDILAQTQCAIVYLKFEKTELSNRMNRFGIKTILSIAPPIGAHSPTACNAPETAQSAEFSSQWWSHAAGMLLLPLLETILRKCPESTAKPRHKTLLDVLSPDTFRTSPAWLSPSVDELRAAKLLLESANPAPRGFFALHPGSGGRRKCWAADRFALLAARIARDTRLTPLVLFGPADDAARAEFERAMPADVNWHALAHRPLRELFALLHSCRFFIGNDSGVSHLAARATRVLAIFGPTDPEVWAPLGPAVRVIRAPRGNLSALGVGEIYAAVKMVWR